MRFMALAVMALLTGCAPEDWREQHKAREDRLVSALSKDADEFMSRPVWLVKQSSYAPNDRTAVFFGYGDNQEACEEFAETYVKKYPADSYKCVELAI